MSELTVVGQRVPRIDALDKVTGLTRYAEDLSLPGMLRAEVLRSPHPHARIAQVDAARARALPGVKAVLIPQDVPSIKVGLFLKDQYVLARDRVRYLGEPVAAVAAIDDDTALEALDLIRVEYQELPAVFDPEEAMKPGAPQLHERDQNIVYRLSVNRGDVEEGFQEAHLVLEEVFSSPRVHQCYLEPLTTLASFDASGRLTILSALKQAFSVRAVLAEVLGLSETQVRGIQTTIGGGFGGKGELVLHCICALLARAAGRPVKLVSSREEAFSSLPRVPATIRLRLGAARDGRITAKQSWIVADSGAYCPSVATAIVDTMAIRPENLYRINNSRIEASLVYTNNIPTGPFRGFGNPQGGFALESMMDMLAQGLGMDPVELRLRNAVHSGYVTAHGWRIGSCGIQQCLEEVTTATRWRERRAEKQANRGLGLACMIHVSGRRSAEGFFGSRALVHLNEDGKATVISGEGELGQGSHTVYAMIAAEELGLSLEDIKVLPTDTDVSPWSIGLFSDRGTILGGNAVRLAAAHAKEQLLAAAASRLEAKMEDLVCQGGRVYVVGAPHKGLSVAEVVRSNLLRRNGQMIIGVGSYDPPSELDDRVTKMGNLSTSYTFAAQIVELEVDPATGQVKVLGVTTAHDLGRAVNPLGAESQVQGAVSQGLGYSLEEDLLGEGGSILNANFLNYQIPTALEMPEVQLRLIETIDAFGPFGAKGVAEPGLVPVAPAVANAIYHAVGARLRDLPFTPPRILDALQGQGGSGRAEAKTGVEA